MNTDLRYYDKDNRQILEFKKGDKNKILKIKNINTTFSDFEPKVYFSNDMFDEAILVQSTIQNGYVVVNVPDAILEYDIPFNISFSFVLKSNSESKRTFYSDIISVKST